MWEERLIAVYSRLPLYITKGWKNYSDVKTMKIAEYFDELKTKDIICWGSGKHFRNRTVPFLYKSGLSSNVKGIVGDYAATTLAFDGRSCDRIRKEDIAALSSEHTILLIAVTGYDEIIKHFYTGVEIVDF